MNTHTLRRENLRTYIRSHGGPTRVALRLGHSNGSYISQIAGPHPTKHVSETVARAIEEKLALPDGWLDQDTPAPVRIIEDLLVEVTRAVVTHAQHLPPDKVAEIIGLVYVVSRITGTVDDAMVAKFVHIAQ